MTIFQSGILAVVCCVLDSLSLSLATLSYSFYSIVILKSDVIQRRNKWRQG